MQKYKDGTQYNEDLPVTHEKNVKLANASFLKKLIKERVELERIDSPIKNELIKEVNSLIEHYKKLC